MQEVTEFHSSEQEMGLGWNSYLSYAMILQSTGNCAVPPPSQTFLNFSSSIHVEFHVAVFLYFKVWPTIKLLRALTKGGPISPSGVTYPPTAGWISVSQGKSHSSSFNLAHNYCCLCWAVL